MSCNASASDAAIIGHDKVCDTLQAILRSAQAKGWTDNQLSDLTGIPARTIKSYRIEGKEPSLSNALSLMLIIGPKAINGILALIGYHASPLDEADAFCPNAAVAVGLKHFSTIAECAADGRIDHLEAPHCKEAADQIIATVMPLSSAGDAA